MNEEFDPNVLYKYEIIQKLDKGANGIFWKAMDRKCKKVVALKKVYNAFHNTTDI
jgi:mitogen-activated protein kinase 15